MRAASYYWFPYGSLGPPSMLLQSRPRSPTGWLG